MACYNGKKGAVSINGGSSNLAQITSWSISEEVDTIECSYMGANWKEFKAGLAMWEGSAEAIMDVSHLPADLGVSGDATQDSLQIGSTVSLVCYAVDGSTPSVSGEAILTSIEYSQDLEDVARVSFAFQGTGALTRTNA